MGEFRDRLIAEGCYNYEWDITDRNQQPGYMDLCREELDAKLEYFRRKEQINKAYSVNQQINNMKSTEQMKEEAVKDYYAKACESEPTPTRREIENPLLQDMADTFTSCFETAQRKNHDYGGSNNDPFANFRNSTIAGVSVERGILVRLMDKMSRIATLLDKEAMVKDEAVDDTIDDAINYLAILKSYRKQNK
jgi:hypothetical protein